jgi:hypothetical protein
MEMLLSRIVKLRTHGREALPQKTKYLELLRRVNALRVRELS